MVRSSWKIKHFFKRNKLVYRKFKVYSSNFTISHDLVGFVFFVYLGCKSKKIIINELNVGLTLGSLLVTRYNNGAIHIKEKKKKNKMGNLTNPVSLRIKSNLYWNSIWISYINNNYSYLLSTDYVLYSYLNWFITKKFFLNLGWIYFYSHYKLVRVLNTIFVIFFFKDYKFYRFVFEYLGLVLKLVAKNGRHTNKKSRFNWYKLKKSVYKNYVSIKFLNYFKLKPKIKSNFFYTCCLYTFYLNQHKYVYDKNQKVKNPDKMQKNIDKKFNLNVFFINIYKLSNFLNLFYFTILLYLKKASS